VSNIHSPAFAFVEKTIRAHFPDAGVAPYLIMGGTDCRHFHALSDTALRFAPVRMSNEQNASCHAVDENVTLASLVEGVAFYKRLLKDYEL
jgi:carboxypeptidase PM20D1